MILARDLTCRLQGGPALHFADVDLPAGGTLLLRGPSGSGKSTWLTLLAGLRIPSAGRLEVNGASVGEMSSLLRDAWRAKPLAFCRKMLLSDALSVADNLALLYFAAGLPVDREPHRTDAGRTRGAGAGQSPAGAAPGGEAQRVALARAVVLRPPLLLARRAPPPVWTMPLARMHWPCCNRVRSPVAPRW
ncbi:MAG: ATP-binding cassette domain-containing protein [Burkholderiaceae bacterium]